MIFPSDSRFCFSNTVSSVSPKSIMFSIVVGDPLDTEELQKKNLPGPIGVTKKAKVSPIEATLIRLTEGVQEIKNEQQYLRIRERIHRDTAESTNTRVFAWSFLESAALIGLSVLQVWFVRRCFEVKRRV
eukprot:NODE_8246_length_526_cov_6.895178_g7190_i0.p1 GENE.NODE_8246_length_526_cov_6.895178_g7190_i0~~NODE_8246_length_526_cov_6.895178_g7190_i0.p1  ORF type:complete len:130 (+),score=25.54 NODE_8246_length_526_cov_6.895178_g7190_i0:30-419(+)